MIRTSSKTLSSPRLRRQGLVNQYRKPLFALVLLGLIGYLRLIPDPWPLVPALHSVLLVAGIGLILTGLAGRVFATLSIGGRKDKEIVQTELYSICRNPLYFASFLIATGVGLASGRLDFALLAAAGFLAIFYPMMLNEARVLRERFGDFASYESRVPLFFPNPRLWCERRRFEIDFKLVKRTLLDASLALPAIPLLWILRSLG